MRTDPPGNLSAGSELDALLALSRQIADKRGYVDDSVWRKTQEAGWSHEEILDAHAEVIRTILTNYYNHLVETEPDLPAPPPLEE